jgi:hypothetical protein
VDLVVELAAFLVEFFHKAVNIALSLGDDFEAPASRSQSALGSARARRLVWRGVGSGIGELRQGVFVVLMVDSGSFSLSFRFGVSFSRHGQRCGGSR